MVIHRVLAFVGPRGLSVGLRVLESHDGWSNTETRAFETSMDPQWGSFTQNFLLFMKLVILRAIIARKVYD